MTLSGTGDDEGRGLVGGALESVRRSIVAEIIQKYGCKDGGMYRQW